MTGTITLYGLAQCDSCRKARAWLDSRGILYRFHDLRADGLDTAILQALETRLGWSALLNRRGTTWRRLTEAERTGLDRPRAISLLRDHPTLQKRPVLCAGELALVGFSPNIYAEHQ